MDEFSWATILPLIKEILVLLVVPILISGAGSKARPRGLVWVVQKLKGWLKLKDSSARFMVIVVSVVTGLLLMFVDGTLEEALGASGGITPENVNMLIVILLGASQYWYNQLKQYSAKALG